MRPKRSKASGAPSEAASRRRRLYVELWAKLTAKEKAKKKMDKKEKAAKF